MNKDNFICFMAHIPHKDADILCQELAPYKYLFGMEKTEYEHIHFLVDMNDKQYHAFSKKIFKDKYKLRGRATKGAPRQYGKETKIKDIQKIATYTCKDQNVRTNLLEEELDDLLGQKLEECKNTKNESIENVKKCMQEIENYLGVKQVKTLNDGQYNVILNPKTKALEECVKIQKQYFDNMGTKDLKILIMEWMIKEKINLRRTTIDHYYLYIRANSEYLGQSTEQIYDYLYNL